MGALRPSAAASDADRSANLQVGEPGVGGCLRTSVMESNFHMMKCDTG